MLGAGIGVLLSSTDRQDPMGLCSQVSRRAFLAPAPCSVNPLLWQTQGLTKLSGLSVAVQVPAGEQSRWSGWMSKRRGTCRRQEPFLPWLAPGLLALFQLPSILSTQTHCSGGCFSR